MEIKLALQFFIASWMFHMVTLGYLITKDLRNTVVRFYQSSQIIGSMYKLICLECAVVVDLLGKQALKLGACCDICVFNDKKNMKKSY